ncbi:MAG: hypothetical protein WDO18_11830 [Acidobacteriota bacterium]
MRFALLLALSIIPAFSQISDIATDETGSTLVFDTRFRMQGETGVTTEQKVYRWRDGAWTRLTVFTPTGGIIPGSIWDPFVAAGGNIYGWMSVPSRGLFPPVRVHADANVAGVTLPDHFLREYFRVSPNGRYFIGGGFGPQGDTFTAEIFDSQTGTRTPLAADATLPQVANDGSVGYVLAPSSAIGFVSPDQRVQKFAVEGTVNAIAISANALWIAVDTTIGSERKLKVISTTSGSTDTVATVALTSDTGLPWSLSNTGLLYLTANGTTVNVWNLGTKTTSKLADSSEKVGEVAASADGSSAWTVTDTNRLTRYDLGAATKTEVLAPLGYSSGPATARVPGSAILLRGKFTTGQRVYVNNEAWPTSAIDKDGFWFQMPWEWKPVATSAPWDTLTLRADGNPFELYASITSDGEYSPFIPIHDELTSPSYTIGIIAHQDFRGVATVTDPARPNETVHAYMTGLGALQRPVATGEPGPIDAVPVARPVTCVAGLFGSGVRIPLDVPVAIYAGGMIGIYQVDVTMPGDVPNGFLALRCGSSTYEAIAWIPTKH